MSDEAEIRALTERLAKGIHDRNAEAVIACQTDDLVTYSLAPPLANRGQGVEDLKAWFATWDSPIRITYRDLEVFVSGDVAFAHGLAAMGGDKSGEGAVGLWFRETLGFRKTADGWKVSHQHQSTPFYMDGSFKAAVDLQP